MAGILQIGGVTLGTHNSSKVDLTNVGTLDNATLSGTLTGGTISGTTTFPDGMMTNFIHRQFAFDSNQDYSIQSSGGALVKVAIRGSDTSTEVPSFTAKQGHTYQFSFHFKAITDQNASVNSSGRYTDFELYHGTTSRNQGDTTFDTKVFSVRQGRQIAGASTANTTSSLLVNLMGAFYQSASDATAYVYFTASGTDNGKRVVVYYSTDAPMHLFITEYKGNLSTILT